MDEFYKKLDFLYEAGDIAATEGYLKAELQECEATDHVYRQIAVQNELAGFYRGLNRLAEADECFSRCEKAMRQAGLEYSLQYATVWMNHAGNKRLQKDLQASLDMFLSAKKMMEECGSQGTYYYISLLNNIALTYMELGRLAQAEAYAMYALNTLNDGTDNDHEKASTYNNLANIHMAMRDYESAQSDIASALQLYEKMPNNIHYAAALQTKATLEVRNGNCGLARACLEHACTLTEHFFGRGDAYATLQKQLRDLSNGSDITHMGQ